MTNIQNAFKTLLLLAIISTAIFPQQGKKKFTITEQIKLNQPSEPVMSPKGDKVLFTIRKPDFEKSKWNTQVYQASVSEKGYSQVSPNGPSCTNPEYSPDGKWITFLSGREYINPKTNKKEESSTTQLWAISANGGEAVIWSMLPHDVEEYIWSDDAKKVALLSDEYNEAREKEEMLNEQLKIDAKVYPHTNPVKAVYILNTDTKQITDSIKLDAGAKEIRFNHDGSQIIYQTNYTGEFNDEQKYDIYSVDMKGNKLQLTNAAGPETLPSYSPDDKKVAFITQIIPDIEFAETDLNIMSADGKNAINLTKDFNYSINNFTWKDNENILFLVNERMDEHLYEVNIKTGKIKKLTEGNEVIGSLSLSKDGSHLSYRRENSTSLPEIFVDGKKITDFTSQLNDYSFGDQEPITYKSKDNKFDIDGLILKPSGFDPKNKYPFILMIHGGPYGSTKNIFNFSNAARVFCENGYVVFICNPRGSEGYSAEFALANRYDLGGGDYEDIMTGVDNVIAKGYVDETRMGVTGGSYGGYMTDWIISQNNRFKAAVSMFGIFNYITDWSNSFQPAFEWMYFGYYYWERPLDKDNLYLNRSPFFYAKNIKTPTLILQGEKDQYTDIANSREMYQALHTLGVPVEFVTYPRAGHGIRNEPNQYVNTIERSIDWFKRYVK